MLRWLFSFQLGWKNELGSGVALAASQFSHEPAVRPQAPCPLPPSCHAWERWSPLLILSSLIQ